MGRRTSARMTSRAPSSTWRRHTFSKELAVVAFCSKYTTTLHFENFFQAAKNQPKKLWLLMCC